MTADLNDAVVFARVAREKSFTRAALALGMPKSTVSERVARLEQRLGVRLLERTTRSLRLTDTGAAYYARLERILEELDEADAAVAAAHHAPRGVLRVGSPLLFAQVFLADVVAEYLERFPDVEVELIVADRAFDPVAERLDVAVHVSGPIDADLVVRKLVMGDRVCVASPAYVAARGAPARPEDLASHACVVAGPERKAVWRFEDGRRVVHVNVAARYAVTSVELVHRAALRGLGVAVLPEFLCAPALERGELVMLLAGYSAGDTAVQLVHASRRHRPARARAFADLLVERAAALRVRGVEAT